MRDEKNTNGTENSESDSIEKSEITDALKNELQKPEVLANIAENIAPTADIIEQVRTGVHQSSGEENILDQGKTEEISMLSNITKKVAPYAGLMGLSGVVHADVYSEWKPPEHMKEHLSSADSTSSYTPSDALLYGPGGPPADPSFIENIPYFDKLSDIVQSSSTIWSYLGAIGVSAFATYRTERITKPKDVAIDNATGDVLKNVSLGLVAGAIVAQTMSVSGVPAIAMVSGGLAVKNTIKKYHRAKKAYFKQEELQDIFAGKEFKTEGLIDLKARDETLSPIENKDLKAYIRYKVNKMLKQPMLPRTEKEILMRVHNNTHTKNDFYFFLSHIPEADRLLFFGMIGDESKDPVEKSLAQLLGVDSVSLESFQLPDGYEQAYIEQNKERERRLRSIDVIIDLLQKAEKGDKSAKAKLSEAKILGDGKLENILLTPNDRLRANIDDVGGITSLFHKSIGRVLNCNSDSVNDEKKELYDSDPRYDVRGAYLNMLVRRMRNADPKTTRKNAMEKIFEAGEFLGGNTRNYDQYFTEPDSKNHWSNLYRDSDEKNNLGQTDINKRSTALGYLFEEKEISKCFYDLLDDDTKKDIVYDGVIKKEYETPLYPKFAQTLRSKYQSAEGRNDLVDVFHGLDNVKKNRFINFVEQDHQDLIKLSILQVLPKKNVLKYLGSE